MLDDELELQTMLEQLKSHHSSAIIASLLAINPLIRDFLLDGEISQLSPKKTAIKLKQLNKDMTKVFDVVKHQATNASRDTAQLTLSVMANKAPKATLPTIYVDDFLQMPTASFGGSAITDVLKNFDQTTRQKVLDVIRLAQFQGKTNTQIIALIRGTKQHLYQDGVLAISQRQADAIVHTVVQDIAMQAKVEMFLKNPEIYGSKIKIVAVLDKRTSAKCRSLDGRIFDIKDNIRPPFHVRCRSSFISLKGGDPPKRASMDGVVENMTYYEWLKTKSAEFQDGVLGKTRGELFRSGKITAKQFANLQLDRNFRPLSLDELRTQYPNLFGANK